MDSGSNSPNTTYNIAPLANPNDSTSIISFIPPKAYPKSAPNTVGKPDSAVSKTALTLPIPPVISGTDTAIPSGMLCNPITIAIIKPLPEKRFPTTSGVMAYDAPMTIPSGKLCNAIAIIITSPATNKLDFSLLCFSKWSE